MLANVSSLRQQRILAAQLDGASRRLSNLALTGVDLAGQQRRIDALTTELEALGGAPLVSGVGLWGTTGPQQPLTRLQSSCDTP